MLAQSILIEGRLCRRYGKWILKTERLHTLTT